jgi:hypothetical protein
MKKTIIALAAVGLVWFAGASLFAQSAVTAKGFLTAPPINVITPSAPHSASCGLGGTTALSSVDGTTKIAELTWSTTNLTAGLISADNGWWGYVPNTSTTTASEAYSVPITGTTVFKMTTSSGFATSSCTLTLS